MILSYQSAQYCAKAILDVVIRRDWGNCARAPVGATLVGATRAGLFIEPGGKLVEALVAKPPFRRQGV